MTRTSTQYEIQFTRVSTGEFFLFRFRSEDVCRCPFHNCDLWWSLAHFIRRGLLTRLEALGIMRRAREEVFGCE